jgi:adenine-specific DNA-methyltransferase
VVARSAAPAAALSEAPSFARDARRSYGDATCENVLVSGDNLAAMEWLARTRPALAGGARCIYLDPPFNTGRTFAQYGDDLAPDAWRTMMHARLLAMRPLLADDGAIVAEIDDTELGPLQMLMDDVFGRENRVATVTVVRSASTGHKAQNAGPVNVADYLLLYAKHKSRWRSFPQVRVRRDYDFAYGTYLVDRHAHPDDQPQTWRFESLGKRVCSALGYATMRAATQALGRDGMDREIARFAMEHQGNVVRFAQPRYEAVSAEARRWIDRSKGDPERVYCLKRPGFKDMFLRGGNRILFLSDKIRLVAGRPELVEPLTNVWDDVPFQGIAREGGVVFARNKKPERLLERILSMTTERGDWVLDPFLGSGTTAAVAHKMGRRWVGIEQGGQLDDLCIPRLTRVVDGKDASGITRACGWSGGGGFGVYA